MAYAIQFNRCLNEERKRITIEQLDKSLDELRDDSLDVHERVHQFRKRAKKIRALLRLFRPADEAWYQKENTRFRDLARQYSALRDSDAAIDTLSRVTQHFNTQLDATAFVPLEESLSANRDLRVAQDVTDEHLNGLQSELRTVRREIADWTDHEIGHTTLVDGLGKTYRRGRKAMRKCDAAGDAAVWHEWRKRTKYQRYQWKLLRRLWPAVIDCWRDQLHQLTDLLGEDHDLVVLRTLLHSQQTPHCDQITLEALEGLMGERCTALRDAARPLGWKLFNEKPVTLRRRLHCWLSHSTVSET